MLSEVGLIVATQAVSYCHYFENRGILLDKYRCYYRPHIDIDIDTFCKSVLSPGTLFSYLKLMISVQRTK